jgi:hypothetical protein
MTIRKRGSKFQVVSKTKGVIGTHGTKKEARAQHRAVKASQARRKRGR